MVQGDRDLVGQAIYNLVCQGLTRTSQNIVHSGKDPCGQATL